MRQEKLIIMVCFLLLPAFLSGCWDRAEINQLGIAGTIGYDMEGGQIKVTSEVLKTYKPKGGGGGGSTGSTEALYTTSVGDTLSTAFENSSLKLDRRLYFQHVAAHLLSEDYASKGITNLIDLVVRQPEFRSTAYLFVVKGAKASDVMGGYTGMEEMVMSYLLGIARSYRHVSKTNFVTVSEYTRDFYDHGKHPVVGVIEKVPSQKAAENPESGGGSAGGGGGESGKENYELKVEGLAVFDQNYFKGYLNGDEALGYNFITNKTESPTIVVESPDQKGFVSVSTSDCTSVMTTELQGNSAKLKIRLNVNGTVADDSGQSNTTDDALLNKIESNTSQKIKAIVETTIKKVQSTYGLDIFGFGSAAYKQDAKRFDMVEKYWDSIFASAPVDVQVKVRIISLGKIKKPISNRE